MLLPMLASANDNQQESLYGEWKLVGWNDGGIRFEVDTNYVSHKHMSIEIPKEGYVKAYSMVNEIFLGLLTLNGNEMVFGGEKRWLSTEVYCDIKENLFFENHICDIKLYHFDGNMLKLYYTDTDYFIFTSFINNSEDMQAQEESNDYIPFVQNGKVWHVVRSAFNEGYHFEQYMLSGEEVVKDDKTYMKMYRSENNLTANYDAALLREENRKVYIFDTDRQKEFLMFDYSLKTGDTYETYSYDEQKMVTYKVLSVNDFTEGPEVIRYDNDNTPHRYLRKWMVCRTDDNSNQKTWIEGVGSLEYPLANLYDSRPATSRRNLAYVEFEDDVFYLPFSFHTEFSHVHGCDLPTGEADHSDDWHHQLTYELEGDRLHVYGKVLTQCGRNNYAYFFEKPTDDPLVHKLQFLIQEVEPVADCMFLHATDFYVSGVNPNMNYIIVDNQGVEHQVINMAYYYYYQGKKIPLTLNENKVVVSIPKDCGEITERFRANVQTLFMINDEAFDIYVIPQSEYEKLTTLDFWEKDAKSIVLTSSYFTESNEEVFATPYLNVKLKKEEDIDLLTSYAEQYKLTIVGNSAFMPLWYILAVTPESGKSPLECANELYESGDFAASIPDLASDIFPQTAYRPFVEDGKVWQVGAVNSGNPVQWVEYFYFDGDTIIDGKTCKQMMCQRYVSTDYPEYDYISQQPSQTYVGAWYEEDKKVYEYDSTNKQFKLMYDFSVDDNATLQINGQSYVIGPRQTGGIKGFKGVYRDVMMCKEGGGTVWSTPWLEGVGGIYGMTTNVIDGELADPEWFLMSCTVGDEVIYLNDEYEDGATPESMNAKKRFDFTHTIKTQPKAPMRRVAEQSLYGEYNTHSVVVNLYPLDETYQVRITDQTGKVFYEKDFNAGNIVGLNINISTYGDGRYTLTMENSHESFTGEFEVQTTGIEEVRNKQEVVRGSIYNLQGQRISTLQKGLNIVNGRKVYVK